MDIQISFLQRDGHTNQLLAEGWTYKSASCRGMDIQISFLEGDEHTNQLLEEGWTYKPEGMDI
jgi:hypothetical protein